MLDPLATCPPGRWTHGDVEVMRTLVPHGDTLTSLRSRRGLTVTHRLRPSELSDRLATRVVDEVDLRTREDFEAVIVGLVRSTVADPMAAWTLYYRNSLRDLLVGVAPFASVHEYGADLVVGESVLDLGSCFGFFALRLALAGHRVTASDICDGTMTLLATVAGELDVPLHTLACDAGDVPLPDDSVDTVTAVHLLEHVDPGLGARIVAEAVRIARRRVVIAVPFEDEPTTCHGHVRTFAADDLRHLGAATGHRFTVTEHHGGWLVIDVSNDAERAR
ncbi:mycofactocin oligosaccharide methyltransferase MftM [Rhodococcus triatomae]